MAKAPRYFDLPVATLRALGGWAADCAETVLPIFERGVPDDARPRAALEGIRVFVADGKRTARLRTLALAAFAAARTCRDPAAAAAARAAGLAASSAYTHPLADAQQTKHIVGPAAHAALALIHRDDEAAATAHLRWAIEHVPPEVRELLLAMPARDASRGRLDQLMATLDSGIRATQRHPPTRRLPRAGAALPRRGAILPTFPTSS